MKNQKDLIHDENWDVLIILDACRHDYFEKVYGDYFEGDLRRVKSECLSDPFWKDLRGRTATWLKNTFTQEMNDLVYVSGTVHINSMGIDTSGKGFNPTEVFPNIIEVWDWGWDNELGTTPPSKMIKGAKKAKEEYPKKDMIVHFCQPHAPYLALGGEGGGPNVSSGSNQSFIKKIRKTANTILRSVFPEKRVSDLRKFLGLTDYQRPAERIAEKYGERKLKILYEKNLRLALAETKKLVNMFPDSSIVLSSDHGEFLGEDGLYGHHWDKEFLTEVPWFEVEKSDKKK